MKLINKNDKFYKECGVIIEETGAAIATIAIQILKNTPILVFKPNGIFTNRGIERGVHIYITSDDEIKDGDWYLGIDNRICIAVKNNAKGMLKIIASTDPLLPLPQPSDKFIQAFIEAYNKGEKIEKVLVEYEKSKECDCHNYKSCKSFRLPVEIHCSRFEPNYFLKLKDNNIIIKKTKDTWTKEEIISMLKSISPEKYDLPEFDKDGDAVSNVEWGILKDKVKQTAIIDRLISEL